MDAAQHLHLHHTWSSNGAQPATGSPSAPGISLVLPAFNEEQVIEQAIREADRALAELTDDYEILVVDDGSSDATREVALREAQHHPAVRVIAHDTNRGYGAALRTGFQAASKAYVGFTDADCQFDLRELNRLTLLLKSYDIACGYRIDRQDHWLRKVYSKTYNAFVRTLLGTRIRDCDCALKLFRRETLASVAVTENGFLVNAELLSKARMAGKSVAEVGVSHRPRPRGTSTVSVLHTIPVLAALLRFWWSTVLFPHSRPQRSSPQDSWGPARTTAAATSLMLLAALMMFGNLSYPFLEPDESRYAQVALEMVQTGDYIVPRLLGEPYLDKPPLLYWATAGSFKLFGTSELAARIPTAVAALLTVLATFLLGSRFLGSRVAYIAAVMLFLCIGFVLSGRFLIMDGLLTLFTTICLLASYLAIRGKSVRLHWWLTAAVACGLGVMTKGPVALVLTLPPLVAFQWLQRVSLIRLRHWCAFAAINLAITLPWFAAIASQQGEFTAHFFWKHHVVRFVSAFNHQAPMWYYLPVLLIGMFPCSLLAGPVVTFLVARSESVRTLRTRELGAVTMAAIWILAFFSISSCKLPTYILPAVPMICLVQGCMLDELLKKRFSPPLFGAILQRLPLHATTLALLAGTAIAIADLVLAPDHGSARALNLGVIAATLAFIVHQLVRRRPWRARTFTWAVAAAASFTIMAFAFQKFVPEFAGYRSINANAARLQIGDDGTLLPVVYFDWQCDGYSFYLQTDDIRRFGEDDFDSVRQFVQQHPQCILVADPTRLDQLHKELGDQVTLTRSPGARGRLYMLSTTPGGETLIGSRPKNDLKR